MTSIPVLMAMRLPDAFVGRLSERYRPIGPLERSAADALPPEAREARALLTMGSLRTDAAMIEALPALELICCYGTGFEGVDRAHAAERGIRLANAGSANAAAVADFAIGLILALTRSIVAGDRFVRAAAWRGNSVERMPVTMGFGGRRLGIYGLGAIGLAIARRAEAFGVEIGYHGRAPKTGVPYTYHGSLVGLAEWADMLVVSVRAGPENRHAVDASVLQALGPEGHLINIARGSLVDERVLCEALESGTIAGAALDVFEHEPSVPEALKASGKVILTPHIAANCLSAQVAQQDMMIANLDAFFSGQPVPGAVPLG
jgi:lactate dehydrogenase-like 2-hydroxyacid dehydrogenase